MISLAQLVIFRFYDVPYDSRQALELFIWITRKLWRVMMIMTTEERRGAGTYDSTGTDPRSLLATYVCTAAQQGTGSLIQGVLGLRFLMRGAHNYCGFFAA